MCSGKHIRRSGREWNENSFFCAAQFEDINFGAARDSHKLALCECVCVWMSVSKFFQLMLLEWRSVYNIVSYFLIVHRSKEFEWDTFRWKMIAKRLWRWLMGRMLPWRPDPEMRSENIFRFFVYFYDVLRDGKCLVFVCKNAARQQSDASLKKFSGKYVILETCWCCAFPFFAGLLANGLFRLFY